MTEKLQRVLESRVKEERLQEVLNESSIIEISEPEKSFNSSSVGRNNTATTSMLPLMTSTVIVDEELNPDSILEEHFARIWESSNQQTPIRSPGRHSPPNVKQKSPDRSFNRKNLSQTQPLSVPNTLPSAIHNKSYKKRADYYSSFDSGMCEDKPVETHRHIHHHHHHHHSRDNKSKNVCDLDSSQSNGLSNWGGDIYGNKDYEHGRTTRRSGNRKHSDASSNLDSGISMVESIPPIPNIHDPSTEKVLNWMMDNQRETERVSGAGGHTDSERSSSHKRLRSTDVPHKQSSSKKTTAHGMNRSQSSERPAVMQSWMASTQGQVMPNQPFAQDPSMPLPTPPNTTVQLEEAKRRLEESRTVPVKSNANTSASAANTSSSSSADETIIGYFFKKKSNEFESDVVFEEIQDDNAVLPLWDGKVVAKVERND
ncbi:hypothetical protein KUTeg_003032 [Tegillarca granosa]|uniref:DIX domain-containing protein n=1 Tax=Tegillarca granosa TaxID=220873 RepID=A0ABQ9FMJ7_TEGGR|nr:hypothetical protein KUTeg_003032 [Tegillarca granosa]